MNLERKLQLICLRYHNYFRKRPLVLNIELTHACNLSCIHCGRIRDDVKGRLSHEEVIRAIDEVDAPIIYFTGGEPFLLIDDLLRGVTYALEKKKIVTIVTNGTLLTSERLAAFHLPKSMKEYLILMFSVDGTQRINDRIRGEGTYDKLRKGIVEARKHEFQHRWINFTIYSSNLHEIEDVVNEFQEEIETFQFNMYYDFLGSTPKIKEDVKQVSERLQSLKRRYGKIRNPHLYFKMWEGMELDCTPWGTVTRDASGWRRPCYFIDGGHAGSYDELMNNTDWEHYIKRRAPECANCRAHCAFEPTIFGNKFLLAKELGLRARLLLPKNNTVKGEAPWPSK